MKINIFWSQFLLGCDEFADAYFSDEELHILRKGKKRHKELVAKAALAKKHGREFMNTIKFEKVIVEG